MKKLVIWIAAALCVGMMFSCNGNGTNEEKVMAKKGSSGKTLEILLVADKNVFCNETKDLVDSVFKGLQPGMLMNTSRFDVVNIPYSSFENTEMFQVHRNLLILKINPEGDNFARMTKDKWSAPQVVFELQGKDRGALDSMLRQYAETMIDEMYEADYRRVAKAYKGIEGTAIMDQLREKMNLEMIFSNEYQVATMTEDFGWIRKETKDFGMGVLVERFPYTSEKIFEPDQLLNCIDTMMKRHVPGPAEGSYMGTERRFEAASRHTEINGCYATEVRCMWRTFGDFMGGPMVGYAVLSEDQKEVAVTVGYVYNPGDRKYSKRDLLMQVDGVCHTLKFNN